MNPLVSIIINNYNYEPFLPFAIESSLNQTYPYCEVIVVDDGSSDGSRRIISSYGARVIPFFKENGGQASALNAGFSKRNGDLVIFLDSDDILLADTVHWVVDTFRTHPEASKVQYLLEVIDECGIPKGKLIPPRPLSTGDLRRHALKYYSYTYPPTSGNAFPSVILDRIFPIPEREFSISADMYLADLSVLFGPVVSLNKVGGYYRIHDKNIFFVHKSLEHPDSLARIKGFVHRTKVSREFQQRLARELGILEKPANPIQTYDFLSSRMILLKLGIASEYPKEDTLAGLAARGIVAAMVEPGFLLRQRILHAIWFMGMVIAPTQYAIFLTEKLYNPKRRGKIFQFITKLWKGNKVWIF